MYLVLCNTTFLQLSEGPSATLYTSTITTYTSCKIFSWKSVWVKKKLVFNVGVRCFLLHRGAGARGNLAPVTLDSALTQSTTNKSFHSIPIPPTTKIGESEEEECRSFPPPPLHLPLPQFALSLLLRRWRARGRRGRM